MIREAARVRESVRSFFRNGVAALLVLAAARCAPGAEESSAEPERLAWSWTKAEQSGLDFLATQLKRESTGYWVHRGSRLTVKSNLSAALTAEAGRYAERMIALLPRVLGIPVIAGKQEFVLTIHKTPEDFAAAGGKERDGRAFHKVGAGPAGSGLAEVHICAEAADSVDPARLLMSTVELRALQREAVRALLQLSASGRELSVFMREGCAAYFEAWDLHQQVPERSSRMADFSLRRRITALQRAVQEDQLLCPDLLAAFYDTEESFVQENAALHLALSESFVDFLLSSAQRSSILPSLLYRGARSGDKGDDAAWIAPLKSLAGMESGWHDHICRIVAEVLYVQRIDLPVSETPARIPSVTQLDRYGTDPLIAVCPGPKDNYDIAWYAGDSRSIRVLKCNPDNSAVGEIAPEFLQGSGSLLGFCTVPGKDLYVAGHSKDNASGNRNCEYWVAGFNGKGVQVFDTLIFGEKNSEEMHSKGYPGTASSARIIYNESAGNIGVYVGHTMKWPDNVRHQAGYFSLLTPAGRNNPVSGWYISHNFDQRLVVHQGDFYLLAHGDAFPRALVVSKWSGNGKKVFERNYHDIPGEHGENTTHCQTGGLVVTDKKESVVVFASANERRSHDICIFTMDAGGKESRRKWLTDYAAGTNGSFPRIARYGKGVLVAWEEFAGEGPVMQYVILDDSLEVLQRQAPVADAHVSSCYDMVNLSNGSVVWALPGAGSSIRVCRIDLPEKMYGVLQGRLVKAAAGMLSAKRVPKKGYAPKVDEALLKKLAALSQEGKLPGGGLRISKSKALIRLVAADGSGSLEFEALAEGGGRRAAFAFGELSAADKAVIAGAVSAQEPDNKPMCAVTAFYLECAGQRTQARMYFARAGRSESAKFRGFFAQE